MPTPGPPGTSREAFQQAADDGPDIPGQRHRPIVVGEVPEVRVDVDDRVGGGIAGARTVRLADGPGAGHDDEVRVLHRVVAADRAFGAAD